MRMSRVSPLVFFLLLPLPCFRLTPLCFVCFAVALPVHQQLLDANWQDSPQESHLLAAQSSARARKTSQDDEADVTAAIRSQSKV